MRDKLIKLLDDNKTCDREIACCECEYSDISPCFAVRMADALIAHGVTFAEDNNVPTKWIPVSERLPNDSKAVLVYAPRNRNIFECFHRGGGCWEIASYTFEILHDEVTHWMPLPEPPKEGE